MLIDLLKMPRSQREALGELRFAKGTRMVRVPNVVEGGTRLVPKRTTLGNAGMAVDGEPVDLTEFADETLEALVADDGVPENIREAVAEEIKRRGDEGGDEEEQEIAASYGARKGSLVRAMERRAAEFAKVRGRSQR